ncbi:hypothetical protein ACVBGC_23835 [Burkholderia stagnalis]
MIDNPSLPCRRGISAGVFQRCFVDSYAARVSPIREGAAWLDRNPFSSLSADAKMPEMIMSTLNEKSNRYEEISAAIQTAECSLRVAVDLMRRCDDSDFACIEFLLNPMFGMLARNPM